MTNFRRGQAHVWTLRIDPDDNGIEQFREILSGQEKARLEKIAHERNRREYIAAHALTRLMLSHFSDVSAADWRFDAGDHGRPELTTRFRNLGLRFNISHTRGMVACAITKVDDIGVDVECQERPGRLADIAERKFSRPEIIFFASASEAERQKVFFSFWTLKESYIKAIGKGLVEPLDGFAFSLDPLGITFLRENGDADCWSFDLFKASADHLCAISLARPTCAPVEIIRRSLNWKDMAALTR
ncbi:MAG: 4'-phosphopantetheinyl transferase superfamily protein [Rhodospirillales bacterium]|nr:4'-phosphopantetheinyl transferase superfamily protein [Rhodospirillales bacterium]